MRTLKRKCFRGRFPDVPTGAMGGRDLTATLTIFTNGHDSDAFALTFESYTP